MAYIVLEKDIVDVLTFCKGVNVLIGTNKRAEKHITSEMFTEVMSKFSTFTDPESESMNREQQKIIDWLKKIRFRKQLFGGVSEKDVWEKIQQLNDMYHITLKAERIRCNLLLEQQKVDDNLSPQDGDLKETHRSDK